MIMWNDLCLTKELQIVKLYVLESYEEYTSEWDYLLLTAIDWAYFYNQIWREFNIGGKSGTFSSGKLPYIGK